RNKEENNRKPNQKRLSTKNSAFEEESDFNGNKQEKSKRSNGNLGVISETNEEDISTDNLKPNKSTNKEQNNRKSNQKRLSTKNSAIEEESDSNGNKHEKSKRSKFNVGCVSESDEEEISTQNVERIPSTNKKNKRTKLESLKFIIGSSLFGGKRRDSRRSHNGNLSETELDRTSLSSKKIKPNTQHQGNDEFVFTAPDCVKMVDSSETDLKGGRPPKPKLKRGRSRKTEHQGNDEFVFTAPDCMKMVDSSETDLKGGRPPKPKLKRGRSRKTELSSSTERQSNDEFAFKRLDCPQMAESSETDLNDKRSKRGVPRKTDSCINYNSNSTEITNTTDEGNRKTHDTVLIDSSKIFMVSGKFGVEPDVVKPLARNWYNLNKSFSVLDKSLVVDRRFLSLQLPKTRKLYSPTHWLESMSRSP
uniref:Uncharacterized protein LOC114326396 n=1 Tax=Diabrotica virgifera virgifera TaxID=50390 RepID=A0A6P7F6T7_DIAVI